MAAKRKPTTKRLKREPGEKPKLPPRQKRVAPTSKYRCTTSAKSVEHQKLVAEVLQLRIAGLSIRGIASALSQQRGKTYSKTSIHDLLLAELVEPSKTYREQLAQLEAERLDAVQRSFWKAMTSGDYNAARIVLQAMEARSKLCGLNEALRVDAQVEVVTNEATAERAAQLIREKFGAHGAQTAESGANVAAVEG